MVNIIAETTGVHNDNSPSLVLTMKKSISVSSSSSKPSSTSYKLCLLFLSFVRHASDKSLYLLSLTGHLQLRFTRNHPRLLSSRLSSTAWCIVVTATTAATLQIVGTFSKFHRRFAQSSHYKYLYSFSNNWNLIMIRNMASAIRLERCNCKTDTLKKSTVDSSQKKNVLQSAWLCGHSMRMLRIKNIRSCAKRMQQRRHTSQTHRTYSRIFKHFSFFL